VLRLYGLDNTAIAAGTDVLSVRTGQLELVNIPARGVHPKTQALPNLGYSSAPNSLITAGALARHSWQPARVGWLVQASHPLTERELATAQSLAGAYIGLASVLHRHLGTLTVVPVAHLAAITAGLPLLAAVAGWLLAGRQPQSSARRSLD
jgi:putative ABC transport system permease protein